MASGGASWIGSLRHPRRRAVNRQTAILNAVLVSLGFVVLAPLTFLIANSFELARPGQPSVFGLDNWATALTEPGMREAIVNTVVRTLVATGISLPVGVLVAWLLGRTDIPGKNWLDLLFWVTFFIPVLPITLGWILLLDPEFGVVNRFLMTLFSLPSAPFNIYSFAGIVWVHLVTRTVATKIILLTPAFRNMDSSLEESSLVSGTGNLGTLARIVVPMMAPTILVVLIMSVIFSLESFEIEQVLGVPVNFHVYSTKIYQLIRREPAQYGAATVLGVMILLSTVPLILAQHHVSLRRHYTTITGRYQGRLVRLGAWRWPAFAIVLSMGFLFTAVPLALLMLGSTMRVFGYFELADPYTFRHWQTVLSDPTFRRSAQNSLVLGLSTAGVAVVICSLIAYAAVKTRYFARGLIDLLSWLPITIPGMIMGLGLLWIFLDIPPLRPVYGTMFVLIWATGLSSITVGVQLVKGHLLQLSSELEEISSVVGAPWLYTFRQVVLPLLVPVLVTVGLVAFISAVRNVAHVAPLITRGNQPLAIFQLNYLSDGQYEAAAVVGVMVVIATTGVAILGRVFGLYFGIQENR